MSSLLALKRQCRAQLRQLERYSRTSAQARSLVRHEESVFSQNGEDGVILEILRRLDVRKPVFLELGASDGVENCTHNLLLHGGRGVWVEGDTSKVEIARQRFQEFPVTIVNEFLTRENVLDVVRRSLGSEVALDVLVIDLDGNDWWLWREIANAFRPAVVVTEINSSFGARKSWVMPYDPHHVWRGDQVYGASLQAYFRLARTIGYVLVGCDSSGTNAFWVRKELAVNFLSLRPLDAFIPPSLENSHIYRTDQLMDLEPFDLEDVTLEEVVVLKSTDSRWVVGGGLIANKGKSTVHSFGTWPLRVGFGGDETTTEPWRAWLKLPVTGGTMGVAVGHQYAIENPTWASLVAEGQEWGPQLRL